LINSTLHFDSDTALSELRKLIEDPRSESGVRTGDIYGLIVDHYAKEGEIQEAISVLEQMARYTGGKNLTNFLSPATTAVISFFKSIYFEYLIIKRIFFFYRNWKKC
jgi:pentatricopeptide repeat protein